MFGRYNTERIQRGGMGIGFRGSSPPWPYVGRGRGGLPRCSYYFGKRAIPPPAVPAVTPQQELDFLKEQTRIIREQLEHMETRISELSQQTEK
jgi:hypothetical protein